MRASAAISISFFLIFIDLFEHSWTRKKTMTLLFVQAPSSHNPEYFSRYNIIILPKAPGPELTLYMDVIRNFTLSPMLKLDVLMQTDNNKSFRYIFAFDFDFCNLIRTDDRVKHILDMNVATVLDTWMNNLKKYGNMPKCPVTEGSYSIKNLRADKKSVPNFFLTGKYRINVTAYFKDTQPRIFLYNSTIDIDLRKN